MKKSDFIDPHLPIPFRISNLDNGDKILYQCPKCRTSFQFFGDQEKYCHNCGRKIDWRFSPTFLDTVEKIEYDAEYDPDSYISVLTFLCNLYRKTKRKKEEAEMEKIK